MKILLTWKIHRERQAQRSSYIITLSKIFKTNLKFKAKSKSDGEGQPSLFLLYAEIKKLQTMAYELKDCQKFGYTKIISKLCTQR